MAEQRLLADGSSLGHGHGHRGAHGRVWFERQPWTPVRAVRHPYAIVGGRVRSLSGLHTRTLGFLQNDLGALRDYLELAEDLMVRSLPGARRKRRREASP